MSRDAWWRARASEAPLWRCLAALWSRPSGASAVERTTAFTDFELWEDAGCAAVPALYALLLDDGSSSLSRDGSSSYRSTVATSLTRAAYALLSTPTLMKPAVVGLDAKISEVDLVEEAATKLGADEDGTTDETTDETAGGGGASKDPVAVAADAAERAAMRDQLAEALAPIAAAAAVGKSPRGGAPPPPPHPPPPSEGTLLCWGILLRYCVSLPPGSPARERLLDYARATKAVPRLMAAVMPMLPLRGKVLKDRRSPRERGRMGTSATGGGGFRGGGGGARGRRSPGLASSHSVVADASALPDAWRELSNAAAEAAAAGGVGAGAAAAAAAVDPLAPASLSDERRRTEDETSTAAPPRRRRARSARIRVAREETARRSRLAVGLYHAALRALPAATRTWFGDLKVRSVHWFPYDRVGVVNADP